MTFGERTGYDTPLALFMDHDTSEWQSADASFADTLGDGLSSGESCDFTLGMFFPSQNGKCISGLQLWILCCNYFSTRKHHPSDPSDSSDSPTLPPPANSPIRRRHQWWRRRRYHPGAGIARHRIPTDLVLPLNRKQFP